MKWLKKSSRVITGIRLNGKDVDTWVRVGTKVSSGATVSGFKHGRLSWLVFDPLQLSSIEVELIGAGGIPTISTAYITGVEWEE